MFVSKLPTVLLENWKALGFTKLPKYNEIAKKTGLNSRTVGKWMEGQTFEQIDGNVVGAFMRYFKRNNVSCTIDDLIELRLIDTEPSNN